MAHFHDEPKIPVDYYWYGSHGIAIPKIHLQKGGSPNVYWKLRDAGFLRGGREKNLILLIHGWHGTHRTFNIFFHVLRFHQKMTPDVGVLLVDWGEQGADKFVLGDAAYSAITLNINNLLKDLNNTNLHCIGHSLGAHACGAVCRSFHQIQKRKCTRIIGLDAAGPLFKTNSPYPNLVKARLSKKDADYVALFMTNRNFMGLYQIEGDEYITPYVDGSYSNHCPLIGKWWGEITAYNYLGRKVWERLDMGTIARSGIIPHTLDSCSHLMAPILFMKSLDTRNGYVAFKWSTSSPHGLPPMHTVWNGYTISKDYRYPTFFKNETIWLSTQTLEDHMGDRLQYGDSNVEPSFAAIAISYKGCYPQLSTHNEYQNVFSYGTKYEIVTGFTNLKPTYVDLARMYVTVNRKDCPVLLARYLIPTYQSASFPRPTMPTYSSEILHCEKQSAYKYYCKRTWHQSRIAAYRKQLDITGKGEETPVPPKTGCLEQHTNLTDMMRTFMGTYHAITGQKISFDMSNSPFELVRITLWDPHMEKLHNLMTFWDACDETSVTNISVDRIERRANFTFIKQGQYWISFFYEYEEITALINITERVIPTTAKTTTSSEPTTTQETTTTTSAPPPSTSSTPSTPSSTTLTTSTHTTKIRTTTSTVISTSQPQTTPCNETIDEDCWFSQLSGDYSPVEWVPETETEGPYSNTAEDVSGEDPVDYSEYVVIGEPSNHKESEVETSGTPKPISVSVHPGTYPLLDSDRQTAHIAKQMQETENSHQEASHGLTVGASLTICAVVVLAICVAVVMKRHKKQTPPPAIYLKVAPDDIEIQ